MILNDVLLKAISWTLVHSLWQGVLLAFCAGLIVLLTKKANAALRYNLLSGLFVVFFVVVGLTFNYEFTPHYETVTRLNLPMADGHASGAFAETGTEVSSSIIGFLNGNARLIALAWLAIFAVKLIGIFHSFNQVYRIRNYRTFSPSDYWKQRVSVLAGQIQLSKPVVLLESALVKVPSVTGFLKPMILVPVGMLSNLPQDQVEAILLHELAHIRRKDYAINLLQHLAEMIFFFNPGLLWLSSLIKEERENCCDDIALGIIGNKAGFVHALVSFEEFNQRTQFAIGFAGKKNHLLNRAKRIIHNDNKSLNTIEKTFLSISLLLIAAIMVACANGKTAEAQLATSPTIEANRLARIADSEADAADAKVKKADKLAGEADRAATLADIAAAKADTDRMLYGQDSKAYEDEQKKYCIQDPAAPQPLYGNLAPVQSQTAPISTTTSTRMYAREEETRDTDDPTYYKKISLRSDSPSEYFRQGRSLDDLSAKIIADLMAAKVITTTDGLSYKLSPGSLIVNGVKQPEGLHAQLKKKYVRGNSYAVCYNFEVSGDLAIDSK